MMSVLCATIARGCTCLRLQSPDVDAPPGLQVLGLRHRGPLPGVPAGDGDAGHATGSAGSSGGGGGVSGSTSGGASGGGGSGGAAGIWAARHSLRCRVVDGEGAKMPPAHAPVELPLMA